MWSYRRPLLLVPLLLVILAVAGAAWHWRPVPRARTLEQVVGMVRTTEIRIAPEISGHLSRYLVEPGSSVQCGQVVALLDNPELWAAVGVARAQVDRARAGRERVYAGIREEQVQALQREILKAHAVHDQAVQELSRTSVLAARSDSSLKALDEAKAEVARNSANIAVAEARYEAARNGPTAEERALADATLTASEAARDVVEARAEKMLLRAPAAGTIAIRAAELGEAVVPGEPVLTMVPDLGLWFGFNLREDQLHGLAIGTVVPVRLGGNGTSLGAKLVELRNLGEFAVWRAARATGDHDLNTFFLRLDPVSAPEGVTPGQTVWLAQ
jgi:HlyD family secretion protein